MTMRTLHLVSQLVLVTAVFGCASEPTLPTPDASELGLVVQRESVQQVPVVPISNSIILGPGERVRIRTSDQGRYLCSNGIPLVCDRIGMNAHCFCSPKRQRR